MLAARVCSGWHCCCRRPAVEHGRLRGRQPVPQPLPAGRLPPPRPGPGSYRGSPAGTGTGGGTPRSRRRAGRCRRAASAGFRRAASAASLTDSAWRWSQQYRARPGSPQRAVHGGERLLFRRSPQQDERVTAAPAAGADRGRRGQPGRAPVTGQVSVASQTRRKAVISAAMNSRSAARTCGRSQGVTAPRASSPRLAWRRRPPGRRPPRPAAGSSGSQRQPGTDSRRLDDGHRPLSCPARGPAGAARADEQLHPCGQVSRAARFWPLVRGDEGLLGALGERRPAAPPARTDRGSTGGRSGGPFSMRASFPSFPSLMITFTPVPRTGQGAPVG